MPVSKNCEYCGQPFSVRPAKGHQRFCSLACQKAKRESAHAEKICEQCKSPFIVTRKRELDRRFCCRKCQTAHEQTNGRIAARYQRVPTVTLSCKNCGNPFVYRVSYFDEYRRKYGKDPLYCSRACSALGRRADADERHRSICKNCGDAFTKSRRNGSGTIYQEQQLCSKQCKNEWVSKAYRQKHGLPEITRRIKRGYAVLRLPARNGEPVREILEHRYVMEQFLGRPLLPTETVHHKRAWDKTNNALDNLELFSSNHGPGGRVTEMIDWCIDTLDAYPKFLDQFRLARIRDIADQPHREAWAKLTSEKSA